MPKTLATTTTYEAYDSLNVPSNHQHNQPETLSQYAAKSAQDRNRLLVALDFSFFTRIYNAYTTIWQLVLQLPIQNDNYVQRREFIRILKKCLVIQTE